MQSGFYKRRKRKETVNDVIKVNKIMDRLEKANQKKFVLLNAAVRGSSVMIVHTQPIKIKYFIQF